MDQNKRTVRELDQTNGPVKRLLTAEVPFYQIFRSSPIALSISTLEDGRFLEASDRFLHMFGYCRDVLVQHTAVELNLWMDPGDRDRIVRALRERGQVREQETRFRTSTGEIRTALFSMDLVKFGGQSYILTWASDITERRRAEEALARLSSAIEQTADAVMITDKEGVIEYVNPAFEIVTGYSHEDAIGGTPKLLKSGEHSPEFYTQLWSKILSGETFRAEFVNRKKNGEIY